MLKHFGSGSNNEVLLGDLAEQYRQNDNAMWYWRQAMKAIPVSFFKEIRGHKATAARALLTGWGLWTLYILWIVPRVTPYFLGINGAGVAIVPSDPIGSTWTILTAPVGFHLAFQRPFSFALAIALPFIVWALCGWLVSIGANVRVDRIKGGGPTEIKISLRYSRELHTGAVLLFAGSILFMNLFLNVPLIHGMPSISPGLLAANAATSVLGVLLGGGLFRAPSRRVQPPTAVH
jgi:hypothetical protein